MVQQPIDYPSRPFAAVKEEAVAAALSAEWQKAADLNREAVAISPDDPHSYNRLATALIELGSYAEARRAVEKALKLAPGNRIAVKHLARLNQLDSATPTLAAARPGLRSVTRFITDSAKATVTELVDPAGENILAKVAPGQELQITDNGIRMELSTLAGERVGGIEIHLAQRLRKITARGNEYQFAVAKLSAAGVAVMVSETKCAPGMNSTVSFPPSLQKTAGDINLYDDPLEEGDDGGIIDPSDDEEISPGAEQAERLRSILSGSLGGAYGIEDAGLSI